MAVKRYLGRDNARFRVILDKINRFAWPGFDLRPIPLYRDQFDYGFLPPRLFDIILAGLGGEWSAQQGSAPSAGHPSNPHP